MFGTRRDLSYEGEKPNPGQLGLGSSRPESTRPGQLVCIVLYLAQLLILIKRM